MSRGDLALSIAADLNELETMRQFFEALALQLGLDREPTLDLLVALNEVATNVILHGYHGASGTIDLLVRPSGPDLLITICDHAPLFDPTTVPPPRIDLPLELRQPGGMGLLLTRHYTDELRYRVTPDGRNELTLVKRGVLPPHPKEHQGGAED